MWYGGGPFNEWRSVQICDKQHAQWFPPIQVRCLREEQKNCIKLWSMEDVFAILPTGFGESLIRQLSCFLSPLSLIFFLHDVLSRYAPTKTMHPSAPSHRVISIFSRTAFRAAPDLLNDWKRLRYHYQCKHSMNKNIIYNIIIRIL